MDHTGPLSQDIDSGLLLDALLDAAVDAIVVADAGGRILRVNQAAARLFRHAPDAMVGQDLAMLMPPDMAARHKGFVDHHLATGERRIIGIGRDLVGLRSDGTTFPLHLSVGRAEAGGAPIFVGILHDQTRRRQAEEALTRAQRMDAIGQMTGGIAHDFNNLLTVIVGNLELLEMSDPNPRERDLIDDALSAAEMGADLTSRLLLFSRKGELRPDRLDLAASLSDALRMLRRTLSARIRLETRDGPAPWPVRLDPTQLQTAIINLSLNAQDAMPKGGRLQFEIENVIIDDDYVAQDVDIEPGRYVRLSVMDDGCGMTAEQRSRALEPFYTTKPAGKGTGLGLSMVYGYVRQSGGHVALYSEPGRGTSVALYFPVEDAAQATPVDQSAAITEVGQGEVVLVVEDDAAVRRLSEERVTALGFTVVGARDADEAWRILEDRKDVRVVFTDLIMPGTMTGEDLAQRIATEHPGVAVLLTSGFSGGMANLEGIPGAPRLLRKPYRQADLAQAFRAVLPKDG
ncbi:histidine kinase [Jannaschia pagri]|uniref:histidine kinase n=1 Tax=Jannaschia pagri TaxID=2829797 RepID=A0ABQ4NM07_9RHOB|nr:MULTISPECIES: ATP-binding protein [unclassified Jannaschia]GIT91552.1 histidine kinase [Jannaschia sp. AI_61]GIT95386.1 histidine kinase [Jannaschia sp. AI_62]